MAARVTRQFIAILGATNDPPCRVTRQMVEVLGSNAATVHSRDVDDTLSLVDTVNLEYPVAASNTIALTDTARQNFYDEIVLDTISLSQLAEFRPLYHLDIHDVLHLVQVGRNIAQNVRVSQTCFLQQLAGLLREADATTTITLTQDAYRVIPASHVLVMAQALIAGKGADGGTGTPDRMVLTDGASAAGSHFNRPITSDLGLVQGVSYFLERECTDRQYTPFVGAPAGGGYTPPSTTPPTLGDAHLTLTYPYNSPTTTLVLRNPEFGNRDSLNFNIVNRTTMGGTLLVYADPAWPKIQVMKFTTKLLKQEAVDDLLAFLRLTLGKEIGVLDSENRQWRGIIINPDTALVQNERFDWTVDLEVEGELV